MEELASKILDRDADAIAQGKSIQAAQNESPEAEQKWEHLILALAKCDFPMRAFLGELGIKGETAVLIQKHIDEHYTYKLIVHTALEAVSISANKLEKQTVFLKGLVATLEKE